MLKKEVWNSLVLIETDVDGAFKRLAGDKELYCKLLELFLEDDTMQQLNDTIQIKDWDGAFTAAHALKGLAGNMGFVPLQYGLSELVILIRTGKLNEIDDSLSNVRKCYQDIENVIKANAV